ncbi:hypothetical protein HBB16_20955 [Pseudonocardia sp. MCCB 268]|nr:hypothetical protein [Pseudonocardia cytotoxica]
MLCCCGTRTPFARLGGRPARRVALPARSGGGKTFLLRALAGSGDLNVFAVKGAELLLGQVRRRVRACGASCSGRRGRARADLPGRGRRARPGAAAAWTDAGVADRVVAAPSPSSTARPRCGSAWSSGATNRPGADRPGAAAAGPAERCVRPAPRTPRPVPTSCARSAGTSRWPVTSTPDALASDLRATGRGLRAALLREAGADRDAGVPRGGRDGRAHRDRPRGGPSPAAGPGAGRRAEEYARRRSARESTGGMVIDGPDGPVRGRVRAPGSGSRCQAAEKSFAMITITPGWRPDAREAGFRRVCRTSFPISLLAAAFSPEPAVVDGRSGRHPGVVLHLARRPSRW